MAGRRRKKAVRVIHQSVGPLPLRLADRFVGRRLVFSDASRQRHGGLAVVLFGEPDEAPLVATRTVPVVGSNELELQAALFGLQQAHRHFPGEPFALFSDNQDAVIRLDRARLHGLAQDPALAGMFGDLQIAGVLDHAALCWVPGHAGCRGNTLADLHARAAACRGGAP